MARQEIDEYLATLDAPTRDTLQRLRETILSIVPDAEQCISYGVPAFRIDGKVVAGFAAFRNHLSYYPFSGSVLGRLGDDLAGYGGTKSALHFDAGEPLPPDLVRRLVEVRLQEVRKH
jgi:uncharacterized protein YdhG (YjbR/CyaY superfamily)